MKIISKYLSKINFSRPDLLIKLLQFNLSVVVLIILSGLVYLLLKVNNNFINDSFSYSTIILLLSGTATLFIMLSLLINFILKKKYEGLNQNSENIHHNEESSEKRFKSIIDHSPFAIIEFNKNLIIIRHNPAFKELIRGSRNNFNGSNLRELFSQNFIQAFINAVNGTEQKYESWFKSPDRSSSIFISVNIIPILNENGIFEFAIATFNDLTLKKSAELNYKKAIRSYQLISSSNRSLLKSKNDKELIEKICSIMIDDGGYTSVLVAYLDEINKTDFRRVYSKGDIKIEKLFSDQFILSDKNLNPFIRSVKLNKPVSFYPDELSGNRTKEYGTNKTIVLPLNGSGTPFGILVLQSDEQNKPDNDELNLITEIASDLAFGLSKFEIEDRHSTIKNALYQTEEKFRTLINSIDDIVFTLDTDKKHQGLYGKWLEKSGIHPSVFLGKDAIEIFGERKGKIHIDAAQKALSGEHVTYEWNNTVNEITSYYITSLSPIYDENSKITGAAGVGKNISQIKASSKALEREQIRNQIYLDTTSDGFILHTIDGVILECNNSFLSMLGIGKDYQSKLKIDEFIHQYENCNCVIKNNSIKIGESKIFEAEVLHKSGSLIPVEFNTSKLVLDNKEVFISSIRDLSKRYESENKLKLLSKAIENIPAGVVITDANASIEYINKKYEEMTGYKLKEMIGKNPRVLKSGETPDYVYSDLWNSITSGKEWDGELLNKKKNGELYWEKVLISPMTNIKGTTTHYLAIKEDISQKKEIERSLIEAKEKAEEMNRIKSNFLANMSHELRTPMIGILGYSDLLKTELIENKDLHDLASVINKAGNRLMETLNHILDLSRIESGNVELNFSMVDIAELIKESATLFDEAAKQKNLTIKSRFLFDSAKFITDRRLVSMALNNLISNAIKFTIKGGITIGAKIQKETETDFVVIKVSDSGIGIPNDKLHIIFDEFRQVSEGYSRSFEGTGLGLTLTKKAVEILGGKISVESEPNVGSTFTLYLPVRISDPQSDQVTKKSLNFNNHPENIKKSFQQNKTHKLLLIDDDDNMYLLIRTLLKNKFDIYCFKDGQSALNDLKQNTYDIILMDINLGYGMNGIELTKEIRKFDEHKNTPVIAVTAFAMAGDEDEFINAGCSDYISKPFTKQLLLSKIYNFVQVSSN